MFKKRTTVMNKTGIHARPAAVFVGRAKQYTSKITIAKLSETKREQVNAKSIMEVLMLAMVKGTEVEICADGADEREAVNQLVELIDTGLADEI